MDICLPAYLPSLQSWLVADHNSYEAEAHRISTHVWVPWVMGNEAWSEATAWGRRSSDRTSFLSTAMDHHLRTSEDPKKKKIISLTNWSSLSVCFVCHSMPGEGTHSPKASIICLAPAEQKDQMRYYVENWTRHKIFLVEHKKQTKAASAAAAPDQMLFASLSFEIGDPAFFAGDREKKKAVEDQSMDHDGCFIYIPRGSDNNKIKATEGERTIACLLVIRSMTLKCEVILLQSVATLWLHLWIDDDEMIMEMVSIPSLGLKLQAKEAATTRLTPSVP